jgi:SM-20-related protein
MGMGVREAIRNDSISWLDSGSGAEFQKIYHAQMEQLRLALNEQFFLGLFDFESHFAVYPAGGFYKAHRDQHAGATKRIVTVILYLNDDWQPGDGGDLRLWTTPGKAQGPSVLIEPRMGTLVCFMADDHWHEVLVSHKPRMSITGWFLRS